MLNRRTVFLLFALLLPALASPRGEAGVYLFMSEIQAGSLQSQQYCAVVFQDRKFHLEKAARHRGHDIERKIYEGELSEGDWNNLAKILETKDFRELDVPRSVAPLVMQEPHVLAISVARGPKFQSMEFLDNKSRKPYEPQLKPLLEWWKSFRTKRILPEAADPDPRCATDNAHGVYSQ